MLSQPDSATVLGTAVARALVDGLLLSDIPHTNLLISRSGGEHASTGVPCQTLDDIVVLERKRRLAGVYIPELDGEVARGGGENVFGRGVEKNLSNLSCRVLVSWGITARLTCNRPGVTSELAHGRDINNLLGVGEQREILGNLPDKDLAIVGGRGDNVVVERVPFVLVSTLACVRQGPSRGMHTSRYRAQQQCVRETAGSGREPFLARSEG